MTDAWLNRLVSTPDSATRTSVARAFVPVQMPKAAEVVAADVRRRIVRGELQAEDALPPETELMSQFGISRPTLREALRILEAEGLVSVRRGARGGARVQAPNADVPARYVGLLLETSGTSVKDVLETQATLEVGAVRLLAESPPAGSVKELERLLEREREAIGDVDRFNEAASDFHVQLPSLSGSQTLALLGRMLSSIIVKHGIVVASTQPHDARKTPSWQTKSHEIHVKVVELIKAREGGSAANLWAAHCKANRKATLASTSKDTVLDLFD